MASFREAAQATCIDQQPLPVRGSIVRCDGLPCQHNGTKMEQKALTTLDQFTRIP